MIVATVLHISKWTFVKVITSSILFVFFHRKSYWHVCPPNHVRGRLQGGWNFIVWTPKKAVPGITKLKNPTDDDFCKECNIKGVRESFNKWHKFGGCPSYKTINIFKPPNLHTEVNSRPVFHGFFHITFGRFWYFISASGFEGLCVMTLNDLDVDAHELWLHIGWQPAQQLRSNLVWIFRGHFRFENRWYFFWKKNSLTLTGSWVKT